MVERTDDGRYVVVDGRRWRASDPAVPDALATELVSELMAARRAVGAVEDDAATGAARDRVQDAKVALGERGRPWWEDPTDDDLRTRLAAAVRALLRNRAPDATICPSDAARVAGGEQWRDHLPLVRTVVVELHRADTVEVRQGGAVVDDPDDVSGPVRVGRGPSWSDPPV